MATISRQEYNNLFGPTVGDKIRLGDTDLYVEIEKDLREYGDEVVYGGGKTIRDGMGLANTMTSEEGALDLVITNVTIIDARRHRRPRGHDLPAAGLRMSEQRYYDPVRRRNRPYGRQ